MGQLAAKVRAKFPGAYDDLDDATLEKQVVAKHPEYADLAQPEPQPAAEPKWYEPGGDTMLDNVRSLAALPGKALRFVKEHPIESGATAGAMAAVPLTGGASLLPMAAAAGLGGAGGAGLGAIAGAAMGSPDMPKTATGTLRMMGEQGATQAAAEGGGQILRGGLRMAGKRLYQSVLKPTLAARTEYPNLVQTGLDNAVPVSKAGGEKAGALVGESKGAADQLVANAAAQPNAPLITPQQTVAGITKPVAQAKDLQAPIARQQMRAIGDYARDYVRQQPPMTLDEAQRGVRAMDRHYDPQYRATIDKGNAVATGQTAAAMGINDETRGILRANVPGLKEQNANTASLAGLQDAIERRAGEQENRSVVGMQHGINIAAGVGAGEFGGKERGLTTFLALEALTNPASASRIAFGLHGAASLPFQQAVRAALLARLTGNEQQPGNQGNK